MDPARVTYLPPRRTYSFNAQWEHDFLFVQGTSGALCLVCGTVVTSVRKFNVERHYKSAHAKEYAAVTGDDRVNLVNMLKEDLTHQQQEVDLAASLEAASSVAGASAPPAGAGGEGLPNGASKRAKLHVKSEPPDFEAEDAVLDASAAAAVTASYPAAAVYSPGAACLAPDHDDEFAVVGRRLAFQLRAMREDQRLLAEKIIGDVMYYGRVGRLTETCFQFLPPT